MSMEDRIQKLAAFTRNSPNPLLEFSSKGTLEYFNEAARHLAATVGQDTVEAILPPDCQITVLQCLLTGESRLNLHTVVHKRTLNWSFIPIAESNTIHCYVNDITERLNLEAQLRHSVKMEAVGQLAAGVAHDFNNILTIIQGHADLLLQSRHLQPGEDRSVRQISSAAQRAGKLIRQLLMFSRKQVMQPRHLNLNEIISNILPMVQNLVGVGIVVKFNPAADLPALYLDIGMIEQTLLNLAINARDAMLDGGTLTISTSQKTLDPVALVVNPEARAGRFVCLTVTDTGCGMTADTMSHLFEPFFTTKEPGKGTGLGLATIYGIMKQHDGWIVADSKPGAGSTFTLFLPDAGYGPASALGPSMAGHTTQLSSRQNMATGTETILIAEDEPVLRELVTNILEFCGYKIYAAENGPAAVKIWENHRSEIKLLLTDMVMPGGMSGRQLADRLQQDDSSLKVVYTSGYSPGMAGKDIALMEGFNFLAKPYPPFKLAHVIREALDGKTARKTT